MKERTSKARWPYWTLCGLLFVAIFGDFIANEKPLYCQVAGQYHWPVLKSYGVSLGLAKWDKVFLNADWRMLPYEKVVFAPVPYSASTLDAANGHYKGPFDAQNVPSLRQRHWLGTDQLGRDLLAGMVAGTRTALVVGIGAMSLALVLGLLIGLLAGYFGDEGLRVDWPSLVFWGLTTLVLFFYIFKAGIEGQFVWNALIITLLLLAAMSTQAWLKKSTIWRKATKRNLPIDTLALRLVEVASALPALFVVMALLALLPPSVFKVAFAIGIVSWASIARYVRGELLKVRESGYMESARVLALGHWNTILRHALPNVMGPALVAVSFGVASAVMAEAFLSFIGLGAPPDMVTWGSLLQAARLRFSAWWLALFPGIGIYITVATFNVLGEQLRKR
jgi:peptide/nickel transport system permease protein